MKRLSIALSALLVGGIAFALLGPGVATGGPGKKAVSFAAPAFVPRAYSSHNDSDGVCGAAVASQAGGENRGDLDNGLGSFFANVHLPQGATVKKLKLFANDFSDQDVHVYLVRKKLRGGMPFLRGYRVMAKVSSKGAVNATMRKFVTRKIKASRINNKRFSYFLEMVVCDVIEPHAVQIVYTD